VSASLDVSLERELASVGHRGGDAAVQALAPPDQHGQDLSQAPPEEVMALVGIEEDVTVRQRSRQLQRVLDRHERVSSPCHRCTRARISPGEKPRPEQQVRRSSIIPRTPTRSNGDGTPQAASPHAIRSATSSLVDGEQRLMHAARRYHRV
jgi:hypothetical protein